MKTYSVGTEEGAETNQKTITISQDVTTTVSEENKFTIAQIKEQHVDILVNIEAQKAKADTLVDLLTEIETNTDLVVSDKPIKF